MNLHQGTKWSRLVLNMWRRRVLGLWLVTTVRGPECYLWHRSRLVIVIQFYVSSRTLIEDVSKISVVIHWRLVIRDERSEVQCWRSCPAPSPFSCYICDKKTQSVATSPSTSCSTLFVFSWHGLLLQDANISHPSILPSFPMALTSVLCPISKLD